jgi:hypothetical protein
MKRIRQINTNTNEKFVYNDHRTNKQRNRILMKQLFKKISQYSLWLLKAMFVHKKSCCK